MAAMRLWYVVVLFGIAAFLALIAVVPAQGNNDSDGINAHEAEALADFLILAVKPEGDERDYKLVEIGDSRVDAGLLGVVVNTLPQDLLGRLGLADREYNEAAEVAQCRAACRANAQCRDVAYVRPGANSPVGVCHLKRLVDTGFGVMTPVTEGHDRGERPTREPPKGTVTVDNPEKSGRVTYAGDDARATPLTLRFRTPVSSVTVFVRAPNFTDGRTFAAVEAFGPRGKRVAQSGAWIQAGKYNFNRGVTIATENDGITTVKVATRDNAVLIIDGIEFVRTLIPPYTVPETPVVETPVAETPVVEKPVEPPREKIPPPPRLPQATVEYFPMPPRVEPFAPPTDITPPIAHEELPVVAEAPLAAAPPATEALPPTEIATVPPTPAKKRGLPLWLALGAIALMLAGATLYWRNHRVRTLNRLTTRLVSDGLASRSITIDLADEANHSLRFIVRAPANINAPATRIELIPKGASA